MDSKTLDKSFAKRIVELRKEHGWSQPELGKKIGTSGSIIGRYERSEMTPSVEVARKIAEAFGVTLDFLVNDNGLPSALQDRDMIDRWEALSALPRDERIRILFVIDALVRDAKARQTYGGNN
jgi:transcriptional regulator with XRE-family HTH domain